MTYDKEEARARMGTYWTAFGGFLVGASTMVVSDSTLMRTLGLAGVAVIMVGVYMVAIAFAKVTGQ